MVARLMVMIVAMALVTACTSVSGTPTVAGFGETHTGLALPDDLPGSVPLIGGEVIRSQSLPGDGSESGNDEVSGSWVVVIDTGTEDWQGAVGRVRQLLDDAGFAERQWRESDTAAPDPDTSAAPGTDPASPGRDDIASPATDATTPSADATTPGPDTSAPSDPASSTDTPPAQRPAAVGDATDGSTRVVVEVADDGTVTYRVDNPDPGPAGIDDPDGPAAPPTATDSPVDSSADPTDPGDTTDADGPTVSPPPSSVDLIRKAQDAGDIDDATAFVYRVMAQFGDPALPAEYRSEVPSHDPGAFIGWREYADRLPMDLLEQVNPYLQRPAVPGSAFTPVGSPAVTIEPSGLRAPGGAFHPGDAATHSETGAPTPLPGATTGERQQCTDGWTTGTVPDQPFRVWACNNIDSGIALEAMHYTLDLVTKHAPAMTGPDGFGPPIPDDEFANDGIETDAGDAALDDKIDIYVMPRGWFGPERYNSHMLSHAGLTVSSFPYDDVTSSGYIMVDSGLLADQDRYEANLVHEIAHVLQFAHNVALDDRWIYEATATWAMVHYVPTVAALIHGKQLPIMQTSPESVASESPSAHQYAAYLWLLMMEQERGARTIFQIWDRLKDAPYGAKTHTILELIGTVFPMSDTFPEFAMRLLNAALSGDPISPRFVDHDPAFPDGQMSQPPERILPDPGADLTIDYADIPALGYRYTTVTIPGPTNMAVWVEVTGDLRGDGSRPPVAEALVRDTAGQYRRHTLDLSGDGFCAAGEIYVVVSNPTQFLTDTASGSITLEAQDRACGLTGDLNFTFSGRHDLQTMTYVERAEADWSGTLSVNLGEAVDNGGDPIYYPNLDSHWRGSGHYEFERCLGGGGACTGDAIIATDFRADERIEHQPGGIGHTAFPPDGDPFDDVQWTDMRLDETDDGPVLSFTVSMSGEQTQTFPGLGTQSFDDGGFEWDISCGKALYFWTDLGGHEVETFDMPGSADHPLVGDWNPDHDEVNFNCTTSHDSGDGTTTTLSIVGTLTQQ